MRNRIWINLAAFAVVSLAVIGWSFATLFEVDALDDPEMVIAEFESSPGLGPGFEVAYLGHAVGSIDSVRLREGFSEVVLRINKGEDLPARIDADARRKSAIGEPFVDLSPTPGTDPDEGPRLRGGDRIPMERTSSPISYGVLFKSVDALLAAIEPEEMGIVVNELAAALDGRGDDLRRLIVGAEALTERTVANGDEIETFIEDFGDMANVFATHRDALGASIDGLAEVSEALDESASSLEGLLEDGPSALRLIARIVAATDAQLVCTLDGLAVLGPVTEGEVVEALAGTIDDSARSIEVVNGSLGEDGYLQLTLMFSDASGAKMYPQRRPPPTAPEVGICPPLAGDEVSAAEVDRAALGPGGRGVGPDDRLDADGRPLDDAPDGEQGSSDLDDPDDPFLAQAIRIALPILLLLLLAALAYHLWRRATADDGPDSSGPADLEDAVDDDTPAATDAS